MIGHGTQFVKSQETTFANTANIGSIHFNWLASATNKKMDIQESEIPIRSNERSVFHLTVLLLPTLTNKFMTSSMSQTQMVRPQPSLFSIAQTV